jgi:hypothetical protein
MIYVQGTTDTIEVVTSSAAAVSINANYVTAVTSGLTSPTAGRTVFNVSSATTTASVVPAAGSGNTNTLKQLTVRNKDASLSVDVTVQINVSATVYELHKLTLIPGECLIYIEGVGFFELTNASASRLLTNVEPMGGQRVFDPVSQGMHGNLHTITTVSGTAYYVYVGRVVQDITVKFVEFQITGAGAGTDTKEVGIFSSPSPPSKSGQTLTKLFATGTVDSGTTTGYKRNTSAANQAVLAGTHLWAAIRTALATTQPTCAGLGSDMGAGSILTTTGGGALTGVSTAAGSIIAAGTTTVAPYIRLTLD